MSAHGETLFDAEPSGPLPGLAMKTHKCHCGGVYIHRRGCWWYNPHDTFDRDFLKVLVLIGLGCLLEVGCQAWRVLVR